MQLGVSSACLYPMHTEEAVAELARGGVHTMELFMNAECETGDSYLDLFHSILREYGAEICSLHPFSSVFESILFFSNYDRRVEDGIAFYRKFFHAAERLGARVFVLHGVPVHSRSGNTGVYMERFERLRLVAEEYGLILAQENVAKFHSESPDFIRNMRRELPNAAFVFDRKQAVRAHVDPYEMLRAMGDRVVHAHLSDSDAFSDCMLPGTGDADFGRLFRTLQREHPLCQSGVLELYRKNFSESSQLFSALHLLEQKQAEALR